MLTLLSQIVLDEVVKFKMIAVESIDDITKITEIVQWIDIGKTLLILSSQLITSLLMQSGVKRRTNYE